MGRLPGYAEAIELAVPWEPPRAGRVGAASDETLTRILCWLLDEMGRPHPPLDADPQEKRRMIDALLTLRPPGHLPPSILDLVDDLLAGDRAERGDVQPVGRGLQVWRGDITRLAVDAITNAANEQMLGCFAPGHACIDNAIHRAAGPRLRADCARIMELQGFPEQPGGAKATRGYHIPARYVLHTVGPRVRNHAPRPDDARVLGACYRSVLACADQLGVRSLALCSISTGVFGYPIAQAASVAVDAVEEWLRGRTTSLELVIFDVFSVQDEQVYRPLVEAARWSKN